MEKHKFNSLLWCIVSLAAVFCIAAAIVDGFTGKTICLADPAVLTEPAEEALECAKTGDFTKLRRMLSGSPQLGKPFGEEGTAEDLLWKAYLESIQYRFPGTYTPSGEFLELDVQIDCLDLSAVTAKMGRPVLNPGQSREDALREAAAQVLSDTPPTMTRQLRLQLVRSESGWQVVLNQPLRQLLSGFVAE